MKGMVIKMKRFLSLLLTVVMALSLCCGLGISASAADVSVSLPYKTLTVTQGKAVALKPEVKGVSKYTLVWSTTDKSIAKVSSDGKVSGVKKGTATVTVKVKGTDAKASVKITVGTRVTSVSAGVSSVTLKKGESYDIDPVVKPSNASDKRVSYSTSNKKVAKIDAKGVITAVGNGTATITLKSADGSGKKDTVKVTVTSSASGKKTETAAKTPSNEKTTGGFDKNKSSADIVKEMKIGWNLGNSLDAIGSGLGSETAWGNPKTTEKMILDIKKKGFNTVRIPVSWGRHTDEAGNVDSQWMARVKEVVDYAYDNGMYVILNSHHDNEYYDIAGCVKSKKTYEKNTEKMTKLWTQISKTFKNYDEHLIFETMNEPRSEGSAKEWSGGTAEEREIVYGLNKAIVKAIRATGGNNAYRHIMVPSYAATSGTNILRQMELPDDDRIIMSVHAYSPYFFAMDANGSSDFTDKDKKELDKFFSDLNTIFVSNGVPVVIGEFGATNKDNLDDRCEWAEYYVKGARQYGITCVVWDNNSGTRSGGECFGLYNRTTGEWVFPDVASTMVKAAK